MPTLPIPSRQRGASLLIALIALLALTFTGLALVRSMDAAGLISGNFSFRQAALNIADVGVEAALSELGNTYIALGRDRNYPSGCTANCTYYAWYPDPGTCTSATCDNSNGVSARIDWTSSSLTTTAVSFTALGDGYSYTYVVERLCGLPSGGTETTSVIATGEIPRYCFSLNAPVVGSSQESNAARLGSLGTTREVAYRATIRITGPRNSYAIVQAILSKN